MAQTVRNGKFLQPSFSIGTPGQFSSRYWGGFLGQKYPIELLLPRAQSVVECPICSILVPDQNRIVNEHLDECIARGENLEKETGERGAASGSRVIETPIARIDVSERQQPPQVCAEGGGDQSGEARLSGEVARQFRQDLSALQLELREIKESFARFESRLGKMSVAVAAHLGGTDLDVVGMKGETEDAVKVTIT